MGRFSREEILNLLNEKIRRKKPLVMSGAGTGLIGKICDEAQTDLIFAYNTGVFRMDGYISSMGQMTYASCDETTVMLAEKIFRVVKHTPVIAGIGAGNPNRDMHELADEMISFGYDGIINVPMSVHLPYPDGSHGFFRDYLDAVGYGYPAELELIRKCREKNIFTVSYAFSDEEIRGFTEAGTDVIVPHMGLTGGGSVGSEFTMTLEEGCEKMQRMCNLAKEIRQDVIVVCHGGPFITPESVQTGYKKCPEVVGFVGASSTERLPVEEGIVKAIHEMRALRRR